MNRGLVLHLVSTTLVYSWSALLWSEILPPIIVQSLRMLLWFFSPFPFSLQKQIKIQVHPILDPIHIEKNQPVLELMIFLKETYFFLKFFKIVAFIFFTYSISYHCDFFFLIRPINWFIFDYGLSMGLILGMSLGTILYPILGLILHSILGWIQLYIFVTPISRADAGTQFTTLELEVKKQKGWKFSWILINGKAQTNSW